MTYADVVPQVNAVLCSLAFAGLLWRLIGRWTVSFRLARLIVTLFALLELVVALGAARRAALEGPFNEVQWLILVHATVTLVVVGLWPRLLQSDPPARTIGS